MARRRMVALRLGVWLLLLVLAAYFTRGLWLGALGRALVEDDGPAKADAVVVLGGDVWGERIETAARLVRAGFAPVVLISGVPVAYEVAAALSVPLDLLLVRKLGLPGQEELAMGAIASGGVRVMNDNVIGPLGIPAALIERVARREELELERRQREYRGNRRRSQCQ